MPTSGKRTAERAETAGLIYKQIRRRENPLFLGRMPAFEVPTETPCQLTSLLGELEKAEQDAKSGGRSGH